MAESNLASMIEALGDHVNRYVEMTAGEVAAAAKHFTPRSFAKGDFLVQEGEVCQDLAFVTSGSLRLYSIDANAKEHIVQFAFEGWWISDLYSFLAQEPTIYYIDALEPSEVLVIDRGGYDTLFAENPKFDRFFRVLLQNHLIATHRRIQASLSLSAEEIYTTLLATYPEIPQRVAQRHIASFVGITPESLSRIRKHLADSK